MRIFKRWFNRRNTEAVKLAPVVSNEQTLLAALTCSDMFDAQWYLTRNPDVAAAGVDAALHYLNHGAAEGRLPGPLFDEAYYLSQLNEPLNYASALLHYLAEGKEKGLLPYRTWTSAPWWWQLPALAPVAVSTTILLQGLAKHKNLIVIIPIYNAVPELKRCLQALALHKQGVDKVILLSLIHI